MTLKKSATILWSLGVVGVILLCLGAIAAPKFGTFNGGYCKSKQSEAKTNLAGLFTAEKSFFGEYGFYTTDLVSLEWTPDGTPLYAYGFAVASEKKTDPVVKDLDPTRRTTLDPRVIEGSTYTVRKNVSVTGRAFTEEDFFRLAPSATATTSSFLALAIGDVDTDTGGGNDNLDVWTIDDHKRLVAVKNDCTD